MHIAVVVQRYGKNLIGGAESQARKISDKIIEQKDWSVDIYTTNAIDYLSWKPTILPLIEQENNLNVFRFPVRFSRKRYVFGFYNRFFLYCRNIPIIRRFKRLMYFLEKIWFVLQGPYCPDLINNLVHNSHKYEKIFFFTYLYYPTVYGLPKVAEKSVLIPESHDETPFYFLNVRKLFSMSTWVFANTLEEKKLIEKVHGPLKNIKVVGIGIDKLREQEGDRLKNLTFNPRLPNKYLLFLGRVSRGKGVPLLLDYFLKYCDDFPHDNLCLVLAGSLENGIEIKNRKKVLFLGQVTEDEKITLLNNAHAIVNPSPNESLSILVLESLLVKKPVLVNSHNPVLQAYADNLTSVFSFRSYQDWVSDIRYLDSTEWSEKENGMTIDGMNWVLKNYSWNNVVNAFETVVMDN